MFPNIQSFLITKIRERAIQTKFLVFCSERILLKPTQDKKREYLGFFKYSFLRDISFFFFLQTKIFRCFEKLTLANL